MAPRVRKIGRSLVTLSRLEASTLCDDGPSPIIATFVINMDAYPERYNNLKEQLRSQVCGVDPASIHRWPGILVTPETVSMPWAKKLIPGLRNKSLRLPGNVGLALAHLSVWDRIASLPECQTSGDRFAVVLEDDEKLQSVFMLAVRGIIEQLPVGTRVDLINLNVLRPSGNPVPGMNLNWLFANGTLMEAKKYHKETCGRNWAPRVPYGTLPGIANVWLSAYAVHCGGARALAREVGGYKGFNGKQIFDHNLVYASVDASTEFRVFTLGTDVISKHVEGADARNNLNGDIVVSP